MADGDSSCDDCTIHVTGLRRDIDEEILKCIFESKRNGGGDIAMVVHVPNSTAALITFVDKSGTICNTASIEHLLIFAEICRIED